MKTTCTTAIIAMNILLLLSANAVAHELTLRVHNPTTEIWRLSFSKAAGCLSQLPPSQIVYNNSTNAFNFHLNEKCDNVYNFNTLFEFRYPNKPHWKKALSTNYSIADINSKLKQKITKRYFIGAKTKPQLSDCTFTSKHKVQTCFVTLDKQ